MPSSDPTLPIGEPSSNPWLDSAKHIWHQAIAAVHGRSAVCACLRREGDWLILGSWRCSLQSIRQVVVVGAGKATASMCDGVRETFASSSVPLAGWINIPDYGVERTSESIRYFAARPQGLNEPTEEAVLGTREIRSWVEGCTPDDLLIVLLSGGGSALLVDPIEGLSLQDKINVTRALVQQGASIEALNVVRRALSRVKGGRLLDGCRAKAILVLVMSDVFGDPLDLIASGPTVPSSSSNHKEALAVLSRFDHSLQQFPPNVVASLQLRGNDGPLREPERESRTFHEVIASNSLAVQEAARAARAIGYRVHVLPALREGNVSQVASRMFAAMTESKPHTRPNCWISGGEASLTLPPPALRGRGGRNMHLALEFALQAEAAGRSFPGSWLFLSGGTDGEDGPTPAAGAWSDAQTLHRGRQLNLDPQQSRDRCDSYHYFQALDQLFITGPTDTNVCDVRILIGN